LSTARPVGVDIQHLVPGLDVAGLSARFFPPDEAGYVAAGPDASARMDRFACLWARKEAAVKAAGGRLWPNLRMAVRGRDVVSCAEPASPYRVADVAAPPSWRAAVALAGAAPFTLEVAGWPGAVMAPAMAPGMVSQEPAPGRRWRPESRPTGGPGPRGRD
ncbi:MAG TPA: 4'-phosphopantetheinyl transferase superfamily protein, partial [Streptosporangiaceae bacterium]|nr:4'-phosphopantetheinyl transferase superfamily protein [Streptosporangiaceae bacterium]